jgi:hypothetical protein
VSKLVRVVRFFRIGNDEHRTLGEDAVARRNGWTSPCSIQNLGMVPGTQQRLEHAPVVGVKMVPVPVEWVRTEKKNNYYVLILICFFCIGLGGFC